jgi:hypothetical protein
LKNGVWSLLNDEKSQQRETENHLPRKEIKINIR